MPCRAEPRRYGLATADYFDVSLNGSARLRDFGRAWLGVSYALLKITWWRGPRGPPVPEGHSFHLNSGICWRAGASRFAGVQTCLRRAIHYERDF